MTGQGKEHGLSSSVQPAVGLFFARPFAKAK
jgi:hypothetical protein